MQAREGDGACGGTVYNLTEALIVFLSPLTSSVFQGHYSSFLLYVRCMCVSVPRRKSTLLGSTYTGRTFTQVLKLEAKHTVS